MSLNKLATNPWSPTISTGRKILRTRNGKALNRLKSPYRIFWTYDDGGENDPDLLVYKRREGYVYPGRGAEQINLPGQRPVYTYKPGQRDIDAGYPVQSDFWAILTSDHESSAGRERGMTFWILGQKIHVVAKRSDFVKDSETYLGYVQFAEAPVDGQPRAYLVNGIYRGVWPPFIA